MSFRVVARVIIGATFLGTLGACSTHGMIERDVNRCTLTKPNSLAIVADCKTDAELRFYRDGQDLPRDLLAVYQAQRKLISVRADRGEISPDQASLEDAMARSRVTEIQLKRTNEASAQQARSAPAIIVNEGPSPSQQLLNLSRDIQARQQQSFDSMPKTTTCLPMGPGMQCRTQ